MYNIFSWFVYKIARRVSIIPPTTLVPSVTQDNIAVVMEASTASTAEVDISERKKVRRVLIPLLEK